MARIRPIFVAVLGCILLVVSVATAGATSKQRPAVTVSPAVAGPHGKFTVSFRAPAAAGMTGFQRSTYVISASTKAHSGCRSSLTHDIYSARQGQTEKVGLWSGSKSRKLCAGVYHGSVALMTTPTCGPPTMLVCPAYVASRQVGTFRFRVK